MAMSASRVRYLEACGEVAAQLKPDGFTFRRSVPDARRIRDGWTCELMFESSRYNSADSVVVRVRAGLASARVAEYQTISGGRYTRGGVYGSYLEYLHPFGPQLTEWDVADPADQTAVDDIVARVRTGLLPLQVALADAQTFLDRVDEVPLSHIPEYLVVDYLAAYGCPDQVPAYLRRVRDGLLDNNGRRLPRTATLVTTRQLALGHGPDGPRSNTSGHGLLDALDRAGQRDALLHLAL